MRYGYSANLREDVSSEVQAAWRSQGIVNIAVVAEAVRLRNLAENVALEDIEYMVMETAQLCGAAMELDGLTAVDLATINPLPDDVAVLSRNGGLVDDTGVSFDPRRLGQFQ